MKHVRLNHSERVRKHSVRCNRLRSTTPVGRGLAYRRVHAIQPVHSKLLKLRNARFRRLPIAVVGSEPPLFDRCFGFEDFEKSTMFDQKSSNVPPSTTPTMEFCTSALERLFLRTTNVSKLWVHSQAAPGGVGSSKLANCGASIRPSRWLSLRASYGESMPFPTTQLQAEFWPMEG